MREQLTIKIKHGSSINISCANNPSKSIRFGLQASLSSMSAILTSDLNLIARISQKLKSLVNDKDSIGFEKFEVNDEFILLGRYYNSIQISVKSGGDFSKNGIIGFMTDEQAKTLSNKLLEVLR